MILFKPETTNNVQSNPSDSLQVKLEILAKKTEILRAVCQKMVYLANGGLLQ